MAVTQNPIIGRARNKFAGAIFSTWKGLNVLRSSPLTVANPRTQAQINQRNKLALMVDLYRKIASAVAVGYRQQAIKKSEYNAFASEMLLNAMDVDGSNNVTFVAEDVLIAKGTMGTTAITGATDDGTDITVEWDETAPLSEGQSATDLAYVVTFDGNSESTLDHVGLSLGSAERSAGEVVFALPDGASAIPAHTYLFFASQNDDEVSDSVYDGGA